MTEMGKKLSPQVRDHLEWLGFIQPTGLVVSAHALIREGAILNRRDIEGQELLKECVEERTVDPDREPEPYLPDFEVFARHVLGWSFSPKGYAGTDSASIPEELELALPEYGETLRPGFAVRERDPAEGSPRGSCWRRCWSRGRTWTEWSSREAVSKHRRMAAWSACCAALRSPPGSSSTGASSG